MGVESDTDAWSAYGGAWRRIHVSYPRYWPPAWGRDPLVALLTAAAVVVGTGAFLYWAGTLVPRADATGVVFFLVACALFVGGVAVIVMALSDWRSSVEVTGPVLRLRTFGDEENRRYYAAVADGGSRDIRALRLSASQYADVQEGWLATVRFTPHLGCVRWIIREADRDPSIKAVSSTGGPSESSRPPGRGSRS